MVPRFFDRDAEGLPRRWIATMKNSIESVVAPFSAHRMVRDYVVGSYLPPRRASRVARRASAPSSSPRPAAKRLVVAALGVDVDLVEAVALGHHGADRRCRPWPRRGSRARGRPATAQACMPSPVLNSSPTRITKICRRASGDRAGEALVEALLARGRGHSGGGGHGEEPLLDQPRRVVRAARCRPA